MPKITLPTVFLPTSTFTFSFSGTVVETVVLSTHTLSRFFFLLFFIFFIPPLINTHIISFPHLHHQVEAHSPFTITLPLLCPLCLYLTLLFQFFLHKQILLHAIFGRHRHIPTTINLHLHSTHLTPPPTR